MTERAAGAPRYGRGTAGFAARISLRSLHGRQTGSWRNLSFKVIRFAASRVKYSALDIQSFGCNLIASITTRKTHEKA